MRGISSMATRGVLNALADAAAAKGLPQLSIESVGGVDAATRVAAGEEFDLVFLASGALHQLAAAGHVDPASVTPLVLSQVAVAVPAPGNPAAELSTKPAFSDVEGVQQALLAATSVGYSTGPSGTALVALIEQWGLADVVKPKLVQARPGVPVTALLASGEADVGFQQLSEMVGQPGVRILGVLPADCAIDTVFAGGVAKTAADPERAAAVLTFLASDSVAPIKANLAFTPVDFRKPESGRPVPTHHSDLFKEEREMNREIITTKVGILGGGPAGLMLSHLLSREGIDNVVIDNREHDVIANTHRAGILEAGSVRMLTETGVDGRILTEGYEHNGIYLRFNGENHHINFKKLIGQTVWLYAQQEVFVDLAAARRRDGGDVRFGVTDAQIIDHNTDAPKINFTDSDGVEKQIQCEIVVGADGSRSRTRDLIPGRVKHTMRYPFAWFGILVEAPFSSDELIYCNSPKGFALVSQRSETVQRFYFQVDPEEKAEDWDDDRIWARLDEILDGPDGFKLKRGRIFDKVVLQFRSFVQEPMQDGNLFLAGDSAHTVPPTGAKGLNLAFGDIALLAPAITKWAKTGDRSDLDTYGARAAKRIWKSQNFSYWMTQMMHKPAEDNPFIAKRQIGELESVVSSEESMKYLAESYTGWPYDLPELMEG